MTGICMKPSEEEFGHLLASVLSPSRPLQSEEFLRGRGEQLSSIKRALYQPGRHALIHGLRGVGKSSLAQTAAYSISRGTEPIIIACEASSTFKRIVRDVFKEAEGKDPRLVEEVKRKSGGITLPWLKAEGSSEVRRAAEPDPQSLNDAVRLLSCIPRDQSTVSVVVIDEFDLIDDRGEQVQFTNFLKQISDRSINIKFIVCGIGESPARFMEAHGSADRYFHTVGLDRLAWEARFEIVRHAAEALDISVDEDTVIRIARISDGFPYYVHFISEKLFWRLYSVDPPPASTNQLFEAAMRDASNDMDMKLRGPYETATRKYRDDYESILWAAADGHELIRRSTDIFGSYVRIMGQRQENPLDRTKFNQRMNNLKQDNHARILSGTRQGWYEFTEKMVRGYVRLRAEQRGVELEVDHPAVQRRLT